MAKPSSSLIASNDVYVLPAALKFSGGDGTSGDMEARVRALETKFDRIDAKLDKINDDVKEIKGKISNMPSTWQMIGISGLMIGLVIASGGFAFSLAKYLQP